MFLHRLLQTFFDCSGRISSKHLNLVSVPNGQVSAVRRSLISSIVIVLIEIKKKYIEANELVGTLFSLRCPPETDFFWLVRQYHQGYTVVQGCWRLCPVDDPKFVVENGCPPARGAVGLPFVGCRFLPGLSRTTCWWLPGAVEDQDHSEQATD